MQMNYQNTPTRFIDADGIRIAYRSLGNPQASPIIYLNHLAANLDNCDPIIMNGLSEQFHIIALNYPGIGASAGEAAQTVEAMAMAVINFIKAMGFARVHLMGFSLGGFVAQDILRLAPELVGSLILAGTGPRGDKGIARVARITYYDIFRGAITGRDPKYYLFFPNITEAKQAGNTFLDRLKERRERDTATSLKALRAQLKAVTTWANAPQQVLSHISQRVWVVNGDQDRMVPTSGSYDLAERLPNASLVIYPKAGHGAVFQNAEIFTKQATAFFLANPL